MCVKAVMLKGCSKTPYQSKRGGDSHLATAPDLPHNSRRCTAVQHEASAILRAAQLVLLACPDRPVWDTAG
ncbi:hypothetical protein QTP86_007708 [Hemibagrus guttatus]|nr:hypothetical protein QTP86_007708 [Hemibagrus guttatus]